MSVCALRIVGSVQCGVIIFQFIMRTTSFVVYLFFLIKHTICTWFPIKVATKRRHNAGPLGMKVFLHLDTETFKLDYGVSIWFQPNFIPKIWAAKNRCHFCSVDGIWNQYDTFEHMFCRHEQSSVVCAKGLLATPFAMVSTVCLFLLLLWLLLSLFFFIHISFLPLTMRFTICCNITGVSTVSIVSSHNSSIAQDVFGDFFVSSALYSVRLMFVNC